jgi:hypothetical protein
VGRSLTGETSHRYMGPQWSMAYDVKVLTGLHKTAWTTSHQK